MFVAKLGKMLRKAAWGAGIFFMPFYAMVHLSKL